MYQRIFTTIHCDGQRAVLERVDNHLLVIEHDQNVSALLYMPGGGEGALIRGGAALILNFGR